MLSWTSHPATAGEQARILLIMLPPAGAKASSFADEGVVQAAQASGLDVIAAQPDLALYLDGGITAALHREIIEPALRRGNARIWLLGISLGGMGALLYAAEHEQVPERIILLAPFIGTRGTLAAVRKAGGLAGPWRGAAIATEPELKLLAWLREHVPSRRRPELLLGYGAQDRFAPGHRMLAEILPPDHVVTLPGGHDWPCWRALLQSLLSIHPALV